MNDVSCYGLCVAPCVRLNGGVIFAEVVSAPRWNWRPLPGRMSRWWYEIHGTEPDGSGVTFAYEDGGSGGAFTLRRCIERASAASELFAIRDCETFRAAVVEESRGRPKESGRATGTGGNEPSATAAHPCRSVHNHPETT